MTVKKFYTPAEVIEARQKIIGMAVDEMLSRGFVNVQEVLRVNATYGIRLIDAGEKRIACIKEVRALTCLSLGDAKDLIDNAPSVILTGLTEREAVRGATQLRAIGAAASTVREES